MLARFPSLAALLLLSLAIFHTPFLEAAGAFLLERDEPRGADVIILTYGLGRETVVHAAELYHHGYAPLLLIADMKVSVAGIDTDHSSELMRRELRSSGVPDGAIAVMPESVTSTQEEAEALKRWLTDRNQITSAIVVAEPWRMRRTVATFRRTLSGTLSTLVASPPVASGGFEPGRWWTTRQGINAVINEYGRLMYYFVLGRLAL